MNKTQINFYLTKKDISELEFYLLENKYKIVSDTLINEQIQLVDTLDDLSSSKKIIFLPEDESELVISKTKSDIRIINETTSPVVEYWNPIKWENNLVMPRGRLYYTTHFYNSENQLVAKPETFLEFASGLFKWVKKNFKNVKLKGYESFLISEETRSWMKTTGGKLADMIREEEFHNKKSAIAV